MQAKWNNLSPLKKKSHPHRKKTHNKQENGEGETDAPHQTDVLRVSEVRWPECRQELGGGGG